MKMIKNENMELWLRKFAIFEVCEYLKMIEFSVRMLVLSSIFLSFVSWGEWEQDV